MRGRTELPIIAHYSMLTLFTRYSHVGIELPLMLKMFRLSGADIVTFPRPNSRFDVTTEEFVANLKASGDPLGSILPAALIECQRRGAEARASAPRLVQSKDVARPMRLRSRTTREGPCSPLASAELGATLAG